MLKRKTIASVLAAAVLVVPACGGDTDDTDLTTDTDTELTVPETTPDIETPGDTQPGGGTDTTLGGGTDTTLGDGGTDTTMGTGGTDTTMGTGGTDTTSAN